MINRIWLNEDIFAHIATHLTHRQLLSFSRASKAMRRASLPHLLRTVRITSADLLAGLLLRTDLLECVRHLHISRGALGTDNECKIASDLGSKVHSLAQLSSLTVVVRRGIADRDFLAALIQSCEALGKLPRHLTLRVVNYVVTAGMKQILPTLQETSVTALECRGIVMCRAGTAPPGFTTDLTLTDLNNNVVSLHLASRIFEHVARPSAAPLHLRHLSIECRSQLFRRAVEVFEQCRGTLTTGVLSVSGNVTPHLSQSRQAPPSATSQPSSSASKPCPY